MSFLHEAITFLCGILAGLGVGSGGLFLVWLTEGLGMEGKSAAACNLLFFVAALLSAFFLNIRQKRIDFSFLFSLLLFGLPGAYLGQLIRDSIPVPFLRICLGIFLIFAGIFSLFVKGGAKREKNLDKPALEGYNKENDG